ncbi:nuclear transport factor 2 family protein [Sphingosinicella sp. CPCC 101087]|uniref:nuclear transport factor 2 family protein n=1 Tax=Sphingosinicella sp. CPCC 101087 TaxID=2497754 RepID=UPI00101D7DAE|nr:nuclear transport factor 2 family protein [Sphingosinicella sp. CPCC 101087]
MRLFGPLALICLALASPARAAEADEREEVLATVQQLFDALAGRDQAAIQSILLPEGRITSHVVRDGQVVVRTGSWEEWTKRIMSADRRLEERMFDPEVRIRGSLAAVWAEYDFLVDGAVSHCGVNLVDLAKADGRWRILNVSFTVETEGCATR